MTSPLVETGQQPGQPTAQRALTSAHLKFVHDAYEFLASTQGQLKGIGRLIPYVLLVRLLQQARSLNLLVIAGYPDDAELIARAMTNTAMSLIAIVDGDSDARALQYLQHSQVLRKKKLDGYVRQGILSADETGAFHATALKKEEEVLKGYADNGIEPKALGGGKTFWHGLPETELFAKMKAERWVDLYYAPFSEEVHSTISSVAIALRKLTEDQLVQLGPTFADPRMVIAASFETIGSSLEQLDQHFGLGRAAEIAALGEPMKQAIKAYADAVDKGNKTELLIDGSASSAVEGKEDS